MKTTVHSKFAFLDLRRFPTLTERLTIIKKGKQISVCILLYVGQALGERNFYEQIKQNNTKREYSHHKSPGSAVCLGINPFYLNYILYLASNQIPCSIDKKALLEWKRMSEFAELFWIFIWIVGGRDVQTHKKAVNKSVVWTRKERKIYLQPQE
jgi:hypothetical protein